MKWMFYAFVALVVAAVVIILVKMLLALALVAALAYGTYRAVKWMLGITARRAVARAARHQHTLDEIDRLEKEMGA